MSDPFYAEKHSAEAKALREARRQSRKHCVRLSGQFDVLVERERLVHYWRTSQWSYVTPKIPANWAIYRNAVFRELLLPRLRQRMEDRARAAKEAFQREMAESVRLWHTKKAQRLREKVAEKAGPAPLFAEAA